MKDEIKMEVIEKSAEGLDRKFQVKVSAEELDKKLVAKLEEVKGRVHLKGFRKGKAPVAHLKKLYGKGMMGEIIQDIVTETSQKAFSERDLQPATTPRPELISKIDDVIEGKADLEYDLQAEILPTFEPMDVSTLKLTRPVAEVPESDVDEALAKIAEQQVSYKERGKTAKAKEKDQVLKHID